MTIEHLIVDRDGVLDVEPEVGWLTDVREWRWEAGAEAALASLASTGTLLSVATNQSGIGRGVVPAAAVRAVHRWLASELTGRGVQLVGIFCCPHPPAAGCACRKPGPGLLREAVAASGVPVERTAFVGDAVSDVEAAIAAAVRPLLVRTGKGRAAERVLRESGRPAVECVDDLAAAVALLRSV